MILKLLKELIAIPSVNPSYGGPGEAELKSFVLGWLKDHGIDAKTQEALPGRRNILARLGSDEGPGTLLDAHMDTVGVDGWAEGSPYEPREKNGRLYGRGSCDTKASLAVFMTVAAYFAKNPRALKRPLVFAATVDEEATQLGAYEVVKLKDEYKIEAAIAGEPTGSELVLAHKGVCRFILTTSGKAAHGSTPHLGESAILKMNRILHKLEGLSERLANADTQDEMEKGTLNIGLIKGGIGFNVVPDKCLIEIDRRLGISETAQDAEAELREIADAEPGSILKNHIVRSAVNTSADSWFPRELLAAAEAAGVSTRFSQVLYMTNAVAYAEAGLPAVVFGPGDIAQAHKNDEYIEISELQKSYDILVSYFSREPS